jgi:outer membrane protein TolC
MYKKIPNHIIRFLNLMLLFAMSSTHIFSQTADSTATVEPQLTFNPLVDNIEDKLPPLEVLIDSAVKNAPLIRMEGAEISIARYKLLEYRRAWTKHFGFTSKFSWGNRYQYTMSETTGGFPSEFLTTGNQTLFDVGIYLKIPVFEIVNQKNSVNQGKRQIEAHMIRKEQMIRETKQEVIFTFQNLLLHQDLLKVKNEAQVTSSLQVKMAEKEFLNGNISIAELARLTQTHSSNLYNYKQDRMLFYRQYLLLEQLVGMKFNLLNEIY